MVNYDRKQIRAPMEGLDIQYSTLGMALQRIQNLINRYGPDADIDMYNLPVYGRNVLYVYSMREENEEEYLRRVRWEERCAELANSQDKHEAARLAWKKEQDSSKDPTDGEI